MVKDNNSIGSSFYDFLNEENFAEEAEAQAVKRVLAWQIEQEMKKQKITKVTMAKKMHTSRSQLDRFLDPKQDKTSLETICRAARALGKKISITLDSAV